MAITSITALTEPISFMDVAQSTDVNTKKLEAEKRFKDWQKSRNQSKKFINNYYFIKFIHIKFL